MSGHRASSLYIPSFMFVSAVVSEIRELNQNKKEKKKKKENKNSEIGYFQLITFPGHIISHLLTRGTF